MERSQIHSPILAVMELVNLVSLPMSLKAVIKLKVLDTIWQDGSNNPLSAADILSAVAVGPGADAENLQRILRLLTSYRVFNEHIGADGSGRRKPCPLCHESVSGWLRWVSGSGDTGRCGWELRGLFEDDHEQKS
ncbi:UNVERIFIED_CONTAM: hypothetical protein Slati_2820900 [Sesamum latifolium]|uniref:O-methyltransferase dimerisation domain-containing protein n=1 Tax=Sesamum latifolium TaxID=2727402 RepID=A0AAW2VFL6_9LAMI